jgi:hypothetical protein
MNLDMEAGDGIREQQHGIIFYGSCLTVFFFYRMPRYPFSVQGRQRNGSVV